MLCNQNVYYMFRIIESKLIKKPEFQNHMHAMVEKNTTAEMGFIVTDSCIARSYQ